MVYEMDLNLDAHKPILIVLNAEVAGSNPTFFASTFAHFCFETQIH